MPLLKPTTSQLMVALPNWPTDKFSTIIWTDWQAKHVPWVWTLQEFEMQTQMLVSNDCAPRDLLAWLIHGVRWGETGQTNATELETQIALWHRSGAYLRAWTEITKGRIDDGLVRNTCGGLDWHPVWRNTNFANIIDDFSWADDVRIKPERVNAARKSFSFLGSLELAHATSDHAFGFACASLIAKKIRGLGGSGSMMSGTLEVLQCSALDKLSPFFQRALLVSCAQNGDPRLLDPPFVERVHAIWTQKVPADEQAWWHEKSRSLSFNSNANQTLLSQGIHPLMLIHSKRVHDLTLLKELNPEAFCSGYVLLGLLAHNNGELLDLPDLYADGHGGLAP